jgi:hypothetical protein
VGWGVVYKAEDIELGRFVKLKFLPEGVAKNPSGTETLSPGSPSRVRSENHPNIRTIHKFGKSGD